MTQLAAVFVLSQSSNTYLVIVVLKSRLSVVRTVLKKKLKLKKGNGGEGHIYITITITINVNINVNGITITVLRMGRPKGPCSLHEHDNSWWVKIPAAQEKKNMEVLTS